jgi:hypothetical protein
MTPLYVIAHRTLYRVLQVFSVFCIVMTVLGAVYHKWWTMPVYVVAWIVTGGLGARVRQLAESSYPEDEDDIRSPNWNPAHGPAWGANCVRFWLLAAATLTAAGFAHGKPWWMALLAGVAGSVALLGAVTVPVFLLARFSRRTPRN